MTPEEIAAQMTDGNIRAPERAKIQVARVRPPVDYDCGPLAEEIKIEIIDIPTPSPASVERLRQRLANRAISFPRQRVLDRMAHHDPNVYYDNSININSVSVGNGLSTSKSQLLAEHTTHNVAATPAQVATPIAPPEAAIVFGSVDRKLTL